jgi:hypothetical protein
VKQIPGVPESITRQQYCDLVAAVGFEPKQVRSLEFRMDGIYAVIKDVDENGRDRIDRDRNEVVTNTVYVPVKG